MGSIELAALLWQERAAVEQLVEAQGDVQRMLGTGDVHEVFVGISRVQEALDELRPLLLLRDVEVAVVAEEWAAGDVPLVGLPAHAPAGPWGDILTDHIDALRELAARAIEQRRDVEHRAGLIGVTSGYRLPSGLRDLAGS